MNSSKQEEEESKRKERAENGRGKGTRVYVGVELLDVLERFQDIGDYNTMREASDELGKLLKRYNLLLEDPSSLKRGSREGVEDEEGENDGFAGFVGS
ncbi:hypothetical protein SAMN05443574_105295 [Haloarcula vallismortis]|uniref:Uncharacterized protein n=2 Tax=Haloarcula vallismortis TaxID=28442 RepID=M0JGP9_HALVA|nr:hypothetical protein [Haloarcula vallismortis]EMA06865.1 hypothetical protein C437_12193 [Haloarcula vallismortis ATCC 29715]SDW67605.1 hypothetical protein SAMN05443574_105295 [Haloarcula vallismortis]